MWLVGPTTTTRLTRPSESIRWAMCRPKVVLPAAGVAEARNDPVWCAETASAAACCQARSGRLVGHGGSARLRAAPVGSVVSYVVKGDGWGARRAVGTGGSDAAG